MDIKLQTKKFGEIFYKIDEEDIHLIRNHKIYACKLQNNKIYLIRDDKQWLHRLIMKNCPKGKVIDHINGDTLDNTKSNLRITTYSENGKNTNKKRFSENDILEILISDLSNNKLALKYNCSNCLISKIKTGELYNNLFPEILRHENPQPKKFYAEDIKYILNSNYSLSVLAKIFKCHKNTIYKIKKRELYKNIQI